MIDFYYFYLDKILTLGKVYYLVIFKFHLSCFFGRLEEIKTHEKDSALHFMKFDLPRPFKPVCRGRRL